MSASKRTFGVFVVGVLGAVIALLIASLTPEHPATPRATTLASGQADTTRSLQGDAPAADLGVVGTARFSTTSVAASASRPTGTATAATTVAITSAAISAHRLDSDPGATATAPRAITDDADDADTNANTVPERPTDWCSFKTHDDHDYLSDMSVVWNGSRSVSIGEERRPEHTPYFSVDTLWQGIDATRYRGTRVELSAYVRGRGYSQFFLRTANAGDRTIVLTNNQLPTVPTSNRYVSLFPPNGDEWTRLSIVADVPEDIDVLYYGISLMNGFKIWIDDVRLARVGPQAPLTNEGSHGGHIEVPVHVGAMVSAPSNLDFEVTMRDGAADHCFAGVPP